MRQMAFSLTTSQIKARTKTVTRRVGWWALPVGTLITAVRKGMGLKKGERVDRLGVIRIVDVRTEPLSDVTVEDCAREGFPELTPAEFVEMFWRSHRGISRHEPVTRIAFEYVDVLDRFGRVVDAQSGEVLR